VVVEIKISFLAGLFVWFLRECDQRRFIDTNLFEEFSAMADGKSSSIWIALISP